MKKLQSGFKIQTFELLGILEKESKGNIESKGVNINNVEINKNNIEFRVSRINDLGKLETSEFYISNQELITMLDNNFGLSGIEDSKIINIKLNNEELELQVEKEVE